jgi:hypothetical protein
MRACRVAWRSPTPISVASVFVVLRFSNGEIRDHEAFNERAFNKKQRCRLGVANAEVRELQQKVNHMTTKNFKMYAIAAAVALTTIAASAPAFAWEWGGRAPSPSDYDQDQGQAAHSGGYYNYYQGR